MLLFDHLFPNRYLITLKENTNRHIHFNKQLQLAKIENVVVHFSEKVLFRKYFANPASRSITEAHMKLHKIGLRHTRGNLLIFEDDIVFANEFKERLEPILRELISQDWDILFFYKPVKGGNDLSGNRGEVIERFPSGLLKITGTLNSHAYGVNRSSLPNLVQQYNSNYIRSLNHNIRLIDKSMATLKLNFFAIDEDFIYQCDNFESSTRNAPQYGSFLHDLKLYFQTVGNRIVKIKR